ncbi:hypothetical protein B0H19DRAFT_1274363 [Mycena capillaripes]|nr:hypothetical protein B0H19DRAFT_1274363 [Mycena capillaripes]
MDTNTSRFHGLEWIVCGLFNASAQRSAADKRVPDQLNEHEGEDRPAVYEKIEKAVIRVPTRLELGDAKPSVHDCVVPLSLDLAGDGWGNVASAEILFCIYSPTNPAAVDLYLEHQYRTRYSSMGLVDMPPRRRWRAIDKRTFDLPQSQARSTACYLASGSQPAGLRKKVGVREMIELLLASVSCDGFEGIARWMGRNIRSVGGCAPMDSDDEDSDKEDDEDEEDDYSDEDEGFGSQTAGTSDG